MCASRAEVEKERCWRAAEAGEVVAAAGGDVRVGAGAPCGEGTRERINHCTLRRGPTRKYQSKRISWIYST